MSSQQGTQVDSGGVKVSNGTQETPPADISESENLADSTAADISPLNGSVKANGQNQRAGQIDSPDKNTQPAKEQGTGQVDQNGQKTQDSQDVPQGATEQSGQITQDSEVEQTGENGQTGQEETGQGDHDPQPANAAQSEQTGQDGHTSQSEGSGQNNEDCEGAAGQDDTAAGSKAVDSNLQQPQSSDSNANSDQSQSITTADTSGSADSAGTIGQVTSLLVKPVSSDATSSTDSLSLALEESPFREVLACAPTQDIKFSSPVDVQAKDGSFNGSLDMSDDLTSWLAQNALVSSFAVTATADPLTNPKQAKLLAIDLQIQLQSTSSDGDVEATNIDPPPVLSFTTSCEAIKKQFGTASSVAGEDRSGIDPSLTEVVAALAPGQPSKIPGINTISDLCTTCSIQLPPWATKALNEIELDLVEAADSHFPRSALWFSGIPSTAPPESTELTGESLLRLAFKPRLGTAVVVLKTLLGSHMPQIDLDGFSIIYKRHSTTRKKQETEEVGPESEILITSAKTQTKIGANSHSVQAAISLSIDIKVIITFEATATIRELVQWIFDHVAKKNGNNSSVPDLSQHLDNFAAFGEHKSSGNDFQLKQAVLYIKDEKVEKVRIYVLATTSLGAVGDKRVPFSLTFTWTAETQLFRCKGLLLKEAYFKHEVATLNRALASSYEESIYYEKFTTIRDKLQCKLLLTSLIPAPVNLSSLPFKTEIPNEIEDLRISLDVDHKIPTMKLTAVLERPSNAHGIFSALSDLNISLDLTTKNNAENPPKFTLDGFLEVEGANLDSSSGDKALLPLVIDLEKAGKSEIKITGTDLRASFIASLFEPGHDRDAITSMMASIVIRSMNLSYNIDKGQAESQSSFHVDADLAIGDLLFEMHFVKSSNRQWQLDASLHPAEGKLQDTTLQHLIEKLGSKSIAEQLPTFVGQTTIPLSGLEAKLSISKIGTGSVISHFYAKLGEFHFDFVQLKRDPDASPGNKPKDGDSVIRLLRVAIGKLPPLENIPLLHRLEPPFEQLHFVWASHDISQADSEVLSNSFESFDPSAPLKFKGPDAGKRIPKSGKSPEGEPVAKVEAKAKTDGKPEAKAGMHFIILSTEEDKLVASVDYAFGGNKPGRRRKHPTGAPKHFPKPVRNDPKAKDERMKARKLAAEKRKSENKKTKEHDKHQGGHENGVVKEDGHANQALTPTSQSNAQEEIKSDQLTEKEPEQEPATQGEVESNQPAEEEQEPTSSSSELAPFDKKIGPLTISALGLKYHDNQLSIMLDAILQLGPLEFSLEDFVVNLNLKNANLHNLKDIKIDASLSGLGLEVKSGKFGITGFFKRIKSATETGFAGGMNIAISPYSFLAAGAYLEEVAGYKTVFGFLMVTGPLMSFGWAEIRGITGGFGYNSTMRLPSITEVPSFPLMSSSLPGGADPLLQLHALTDTQSSDAWITPLNSSIWIAAGLTVKAVKLLDVQAIITFEMNDGLKIGIIGEAVATVPPGKAPSDTGVFMAIDLDLMASLDLKKGIIQVEAQLSPASFILSRDCHLTGGFALCAWFGSESGHRGDWVFSVGGYHPAYSRPFHYPDPPRLGISWSFDSHISITGEAYFAITPSCCMGGGKLSATCELGPISAHFDAHADMLMMYKPFHYMLDAAVTMGVKFEMKVIFVRIRISIDVGATVHLEGPPMSGEAHVNLAIVSFTVLFGSPAAPAPPLTLEEFWDLLLQTSSSDKQAGALDSHVVAIADGLMPTDTPATPTDLGTLRPGSLLLQIHSRAALSAVNVNGSKSDTVSPEKIFAKPMRTQSPMSSTLTVEIKLQSSAPDAKALDFRQASLYDTVPAALWDQYDPYYDGVGQNKNAFHSDRKALISHLLGVEIKPPLPKWSKESIPPFSDKTLSQTDEIKGDLSKSEDVKLPKLEIADKRKLRATWGNDMTTASFDTRDLLRDFAATVKKGQPDVASRYSQLETRPAKKIFHHYELYYGNDPSIIKGVGSDLLVPPPVAAGA